MADNPRTFADVQRTVHSLHKISAIKDTLSFYDTWYEFYEQDLKLLDYQAPRLASMSLADVMPEDRDQALILDVACGTGLVAMQLQNLGFCKFHGLDGSERMLQIAQSKSVYQTLQKCIIGAEPLPLSSDTYDAVLIVGALSEGQVPCTIVTELHRVTKPGGFVCMTTRRNVSNQLYNSQLQAVIEKMEQKGLWVKVKAQEIEQWEKATSGHETKQDSTYIPGTIYIYQKSKGPELKK
ncbi:methyltransferase-like protein 27 isoform X1 [Hypanus sabinus]|uniref:methyltransferase-like protein 27 isoform X1 n=1 Tax=Hypanus sabinus TaxID=79690 RepID=UPI0028C3833A|nr:methyltransferase-like protein 27 isoform X1 [Hypanus sabinus]XP_059829114.1 methyltransferase-like protein 27 isoform X1 [Hypanus sabinus]